MLSAFLFALAGLSASAPAPQVAYASDSARSSKGHAPIPARASARDGERGRVIGACNPDPLKGRACRHHQAKAEEKPGQAFAEARTEAAAGAPSTR